MSNDPSDDELHNELAGRERIANLPISKALMSRLEEAEGPAVDPRTAALIAAIVSLEELVRGGDPA